MPDIYEFQKEDSSGSWERLVVEYHNGDRETFEIDEPIWTWTHGELKTRRVWWIIGFEEDSNQNGRPYVRVETSDPTSDRLVLAGDIVKLPAMMRLAVEASR